MSAVNPLNVPVLVVGAGPAGLATTIGLGRHGVGSMLIERHPSTSIFPKASGISTRTMEIMRSWGLEPAVRAQSLAALPFAPIRETLMSPDLATVPLNFPTDEQALAVSPTRPSITPQDRIEPIMVDRARSLPGVDLRFNTELVTLDQDADGVTAIVRSTLDGTTYPVRAAYVVAADGTRSTARDLLGIETRGPSDLGEFVVMLFRADLWSHLPQPWYGLYELTGPVTSVLVPTGGDDRWVLGKRWDPRSETFASYTPERCIELIRQATGMPRLDVDLIATMPLQFVAHAADRVRDGRAFLIGDAAHRMPPFGGRGLNTAIADAFGLSWKLAWVLRGWADPALLDSHAAEREPVGRHNLALAASQRDAATPDGLIEDLGYVYRSAVIDGGTDDEAALDYAFPAIATPGARLPHAWLDGPQGRISTHDLVGPGFTLITGSGGSGWVDAVQAIEADVPMQLSGHVVGGGSLHGNTVFDERFDLGGDGAVLVRPDGHIAWRREAGSIKDFEAELRSAIGMALGRRRPAKTEPVARIERTGKAAA